MKPLDYLGLPVKDCVTGFSGVVSSVSFDLYGCIQAVVTPKMDARSKETTEGRWFDLKRLTPTSSRPVMEQPKFEVIPGGSRIPAVPSKPLP